MDLGEIHLRICHFSVKGHLLHSVMHRQVSCRAETRHRQAQPINLGAAADEPVGGQMAHDTSCTTSDSKPVCINQIRCLSYDPEQHS